MFRENESIISKADVLKYLYSKLPIGAVERVGFVRAGDFKADPDTAIKRVQKEFPSGSIVVRSSSVKEDSYLTSNAGHFDSVLHVDASSKEEVGKAIEHVLASYLEGEEEYEGFLDEQVLIQTESENVICAGVIFTRDIRQNRPYFTINYSEDGTTDAVTSGRGGKVLHIARDIDEEMVHGMFRPLIHMVRRILELTSIDNLDIEFGIRKNGTVVIFQCRPLAAVIGKEVLASDEEIFQARQDAHSIYQNLNDILSDMAFWNPSEIIGDNPFPLDYSLYREIITAYIWSAGISSMGYHYVNGDLMYQLGNKPYISVDKSFEGLIPEALPPRLQKKLKTYYINRLIDDPSAHDKIEFEIVFSVYDFCTDENLDKLLDYGFTKNEIMQIRRSLFSITELAVRSYSEIYQEDMQSLENMRVLRHDIRHAGGLTSTDPKLLLDFVGQLLESIKSDGTPQFSRMARLAFIAKSFTKTLVSKGYVSDERMDLFNRSINTVASDFERDFDALSAGELSKEKLNDKYGHLRLGTYNIRTDCYSDMYFEQTETPAVSVHKEKIVTDFTPHLEAVQRALDDYEMDFDAEVLLDYIRKTTENREFFKFEFTKSLSLLLNILIHFGKVTGIERNDLSYLTITDFFMYSEMEDLLPYLKERIQMNKKIFEINSCLMLPEIIFAEQDIDEIAEAASRPNFITSANVTAPVVLLDQAGSDVDIDGKIVVITKADPGYDWIFTRNIAGFISRYGGAASHMAIRCAEFNVPAAIGCGERIFHDVCQMQMVRLDCQKHQISEP